jgi:hypothetical protein
VEELAGVERRLMERAAGSADGDAKGDAGVGELLQRGEAREELAAQGRADDGGREVELVDEDLAVEATGGHGTEEGATEGVVVGGVVAAEDLGEGGGGAVELDGDDASEGEVHAMRAASILHELQRARRRLAMKSAEQVTEGGRLQAAG